MFADVVAEVEGADDDALMARLRSLEARRRSDAADEALVLAELERRRVFAGDGHATMWGLLRSAVGWSDNECRSRMRLARLVAEFPDAGECLAETWAPVASIVEIGRGYANPRCGEQIDSAIGTMLTEACRCEYDDIRLLVRRWEQLADTDGAHRDQLTEHDNRTAHVNVWNGSCTMTAQFGELDGLQIREIFERYVQAEWHTDWDTSVAEHGDKAATALMLRTAAQRRADALTKIFLTAASAAPGAKAPVPVVNIHLDHHSFSDLMVHAGFFPGHVTNPFEQRGTIVSERRCDTEHGDPVDPRTALQLALEGYVRFVIHDDHGIPIHWGRTRRLFTGAARDAVISLSPRCTHPGCRVRSRRSHIDHTIDYSRAGPTDPDNGNPRCPKHNLLKNRGFTVARDHRGDWHTYRPDGTEIP